MTIRPSFTIRPSTPEDDVGIRKVQVATWKSTYRGMMPDEILDQMTVENPPKRSKQPDPKLVESKRAFVATDENGEIIGFSAGGISRTNEYDFPSELWAIYVLQSNQGQGIGKALFEAVHRELSSSYKKMIIWVLEANHSAHRFYEKLGGTRLSLTKPFIWDGKPVASEIAFGWELQNDNVAQVERKPMNLQLKNGFYISDITPADKPAFLEHLKEKQIYDQTLNIPYPYTETEADWWINRVSEETTKQGRSVNWAIRRKDGYLIGGIGFHGLEVGKSHKAELGYWLAKPYWSQGIMTEAASVVSDFGFNEFDLIRITANVFAFNLGSARVLEKSGFQLEGFLRKHYKKDGKIFDGKLYAKIREGAL